MSRPHIRWHRRRDLANDIDDIINGISPLGKDGKAGEEFNHKAEEHNIRDQATVVQIVYKTMAPTFDGPVAGYSTLQEDNRPPPTNAPKKQPDPTSIKQLETNPKETLSEKGGTSKPSQAEISIPTAIRPTQLTDAVDTVLAKATGSPTPSPSSTQVGNHQTASSATPIASASSTTGSAPSASGIGVDPGTGPGAKAGIALGVLGGVLLVGLVAFLLFRRHRHQTRNRHLRGDGEKLPGATRGASEPNNGMLLCSNPNAPRISLRPVTQFFPNWNLEKRVSKGVSLALDASSAVGLAVSSDGSDRPDTSQSNHPANPFGHGAEHIPSPIEEESSVPTPSSPLRPVANEKAPTEEPLTTDGTDVAAEAVAGPVAAPGATALARKTSMRIQNNVDLTVTGPLGHAPPSPVGTIFSLSSTTPGPALIPSKSAVDIAAAGGPPNSTVHRVQLDFKPTLEDELGLNAGDLVRLLHEYDDGWALVIRLDRSQQGVVPRACFSTRAVKPRPPQGWPRVNPSGHSRGPNSPLGQRSPPPRCQLPVTPQRIVNDQGRSSQPRTGLVPGSHPASPTGPPMSSSGAGRPYSPKGGSMSPASHPMSPGARTAGPPSGRSQNPDGMSQGIGPSRPSPMDLEQASPSGPPAGLIGRKPVPGQAL